MARSIATIQAQIVSTYVSNMATAGVTIDTTTWSATSIERLITYVVAFCINVLEQFFDLFTADVNAAIAALFPGTKEWYVGMAEAFQFGFALPADTDLYDNTGYTDDQVAASKVVTYAACVEQSDNYGHIYLRLKVATTSGSDLAPLTNDQLTSFTAYMQQIKYAGVKLICTSGTPDSIKQSWRIFYNPQILSPTGARLDGTSDTPVQDAIKAYLQNLSFNGLYDIQKNVDAVQAVQGVADVDLDTCLATYGNLPFSGVDTYYTPDAGYLRFASDADLVITFIPFNN